MILTRYAVRGIGFGKEVLGVAPLSSFGLLQALPDAFSSIGAGSDIEQALIGTRVLHDGFSVAFDGEHDGPLALLELFQKIARAAAESGQRLNVFRDIKHWAPVAIKAPFQVLSEAVDPDSGSGRHRGRRSPATECATGGYRTPGERQRTSPSEGARHRRPSSPRRPQCGTNRCAVPCPLAAGGCRSSEMECASRRTRLCAAHRCGL